MISKYACPCDKSKDKNHYQLKIGNDHAILITCSFHANSLSEFKTITILKKI